MFRIREDQIEAFERHAIERFCGRAAAHLRERHADALQGRGREALLDAVRAAVLEARAHGVVTERDLVRYLELLVTTGGLDAAARAPWIREILADGWTPAATKVDALAERAGREARR